MKRFAPNEFKPYFAIYIEPAVARNLDIVPLLELGLKDTCDFFKGIPAQKELYAYAEQKWTIREILLHLIDTERIFSYRALRIARNDKTNLPGFDENDFARNSKANMRTLQELTEEFKAVRHATLSLFRRFDADDWSKTGMASNSEISVRAIGFILAGHAIHHERIIKERYL